MMVIIAAMMQAPWYLASQGLLGLGMDLGLQTAGDARALSRGDAGQVWTSRPRVITLYISRNTPVGCPSISFPGTL